MFKLLIPSVQSDLYRYTSKVSFSAFRKAWRIPGFKFGACMRLANHYGKFTLIGIVSRILYRHYFVKYGIQIPRETKIGKGMRISHWGGIVINKAAVIGDNCYISHNMTIGHTKRGKLQGCPTIGNKVWLGPGALVVGKITIGDNVLIAGNAYVNMDVPSNSVVSGNPATIIPKENATEGYITNVVE